eukprot:TRINITY_DN2706_c0_g1_i1.p1 TRINITY_DN2706_c0_g1~~TRINITY_DN2706_c0_g1_i1.p1  ORF type:complete len:332 (-),score=25.72 TRINITY_DN2706_c0_g1_i1:365-1360(-)
MCTHQVVVKNTFLNVLEDGEEDEVRTVPRQRSHPTLRPHLADPPGCGVKDSSDKSGFNRLESCGSTRTSGSREESGDVVSGCSYDGCSANVPAISTPDSSVSARAKSFAQCVSPLTVGWLSQQNTREWSTTQKQRVYEHAVIPSEWQGKTSVMVRNISYKCSRAVFCRQLDKHGFENLYDYVYVPINVGRGTSKGYAFANFASDAVAYRFKALFDGRKMDVPGGLKPLQVIPANLQGYMENASHYVGKQSELAAAAAAAADSKASVTQGPQTRSELLEAQSSSSDSQSHKSSEGAVAASSEVKRMELSSCHRCQKQVLPRARFCQWCGAAF